MDTDDSRSRSATNTTRRPPSRESTTSMQSAKTNHQPAEIAPVPQPQPQQIQHQQVPQLYHGVSADNMAAMLQAAPDFNPQLIHPHGQIQHPATNGIYATSQSFSLGQPVSAHTHHHQGLAYSNQFNPLRSASLPPQEAAVKMEDQTKKAPSATATNDRELRDLLRRNRNRPLTEVASEVIATERTSKSERTKQLFAMLWLEANTKPSKTSVPRSRVYSTYASRCATERVQPLNPASFGKLVRVIWPGIQTRRLGVRGESKYHYVDLCLINDPQENPQATRQRNMSVTSKTTETPVIDFNSMPHLVADTAVLPTDDQSVMGSPVLAPTHSLPTASESRVFTDYHTPGLNTDTYPTASSYEQHLAFTTLDTTPPNKNDPIELPDIFQYAPPKTDVDAAGALVALYKTHITSLIDCVRYCKEKQFFRLFTTIQGTMTVPVHKLFVHADIAPWIRECDWLMYQKMIKCVANLALQVVPPVVVKFLDTVQRTLHSHISNTFHAVPHYVLEAKLEPATLFANLLHRMLKVNQAAHAAARVLEGPEVREIMWRDYVRVVNPKRIVETELPGCGYDAAYHILTTDMRTLLEPLPSDPFSEVGTHFEGSADAAALNYDYVAIETSVDKIATFLSTIGTRFPNAPARRIIDCVSLLGNAIVREMVTNTMISYNPWVITQIFFSEMALWLASLGGFLEHNTHPDPSRTEDTTPALSATEMPNGTGTATGSRALSRAASISGGALDDNGGVSLHNSSGATVVVGGIGSTNSEFLDAPGYKYGPLYMLAVAANRILAHSPSLQNASPLAGDGPTAASLGGIAQAAAQLHFSSFPDQAHALNADTAPFGVERQSGVARQGLGVGGVEEMDGLHDDSGIGMGLIDEDGGNKMEGVRVEQAVQRVGSGGFTALNMS